MFTHRWHTRHALETIGKNSGTVTPKLHPTPIEQNNMIAYWDATRCNHSMKFTIWFWFWCCPSVVVDTWVFAKPSRGNKPQVFWDNVDATARFNHRVGPTEHPWGFGAKCLAWSYGSRGKLSMVTFISTSMEHCHDWALAGINHHINQKQPSFTTFQH